MEHGWMSKKKNKRNLRPSSLLNRGINSSTISSGSGLNQVGKNSYEKSEGIFHKNFR